MIHNLESSLDMICSVYTISLILAKCLGSVTQHFYYSFYICNCFQTRKGVDEPLSVGDHLEMGRIRVPCVGRLGVGSYLCS
jgi:hypothetical protein